MTTFFSCISIFGWTICCLCPSTYESTIPEGQVAAEVPLEQLQRWLWTSLLFKWLGMIIWLGQLLASMIFLRYHLWPFDHSPFIFMVVHLSLNWTSNCSAHGCPSKTLPIPCDAVPFLQRHGPFRIGILCPTSLNGYAGYAAMLWIYGCHHWDQAGRPFHNSLGATRFLHLSQWNWQYHTIPTNFRKRSRLVVALTEVDGTSRNEVTFFAMIQQVLSQCGRSLGLCG